MRRLLLICLLSIISISAKTLFLFDIDGTLTVPRQKVTQPILDILKQLMDKGYSVGLVGGSDLAKIQEQMGQEVSQQFDYVFSENGLVAFKNGTLINTSSIKNYLSEAQLQELINFCLHYIASLDIPAKRGTFIEFRNGMINVSPVGRNCTQEERIAFNKFDQQHNIRPTMVKKLQETFAHFNLTFSIGGQISIDIFPKGWDKTYCLKFVDDFDTILFFGDKTMPGGNDHEIYASARTQGYTVYGPDHLISLLTPYLHSTSN
jgi:phosphomannomutase